MTEKTGTKAILKTTAGDITVQFFDDKTPKTVANFVELANGTKTGKPYYNGTIFHRVIPNFMVQGGDPTGTGRGGPGYNFEDEFHPSLKFDRKGLLGMANPGRPNSNGSQFFITVVPTPHLTNHHTIFGEVVAGMDVVDKIVGAPRNREDRPDHPDSIQSIEILK